jgi:hypothetical protein
MHFPCGDREPGPTPIRLIAHSLIAHSLNEGSITMPILTQPAFGPKVALGYVTAGMLIDVWTLVWYFTRDYELSRSQQFWTIGLVLTGLTFIVLGLLLGPLGRQARRAELPPPEETRAEAAIQRTAAANPPAVANAVGNPGVSAPSPAAPAAPQAPPGMVTVNPQVRTT